MTEIKFRLKELYAEKGLTQKAIAKEAGIRESTLSGYAKNFRSSIDIAVLIKLVNYFEVESLDEIIEIVHDDK